MVLQPDNLWFKGMNSEEAIDTVLDGIEDGEAPPDFLIS
jgi:hypothetical protein